MDLVLIETARSDVLQSKIVENDRFPLVEDIFHEAIAEEYSLFKSGR